jgi:hypothetical protein
MDLTIEVASRKPTLLLGFTRWRWLITSTRCSRLKTPNDLLRSLHDYSFLRPRREFGQITSAHDILSGESSFLRDESNGDRTDSSAPSAGEFLILPASLFVFNDDHRSLTYVHYPQQSRIDKPVERQMYLRRCYSCQTEPTGAVRFPPSLFASETINTGIGEPLHADPRPQNTPCS